MSKKAYLFVETTADVLLETGKKNYETFYKKLRETKHIVCIETIADPYYDIIITLEGKRIIELTSTPEEIREIMDIHDIRGEMVLYIVEPI